MLIRGISVLLMRGRWLGSLLGFLSGGSSRLAYILHNISQTRTPVFGYHIN